MAGERSIDLPTRAVGDFPASLARCAASGLLGLLGAFALLVVMRRAAGALEHSLEPAVLAATGLLVAAAAAAIRLGWPASPTAHGGPFDWAVMLLTSLSVGGLGASLCLPGTPALGTFVFCTLLLAEESWAWARHVRRWFDAGSPNAGWHALKGRGRREGLNVVVTDALSGRATPESPTAPNK